MPKPVSAGALLFRRTAAGLEVLLVHPSGSYNRRAPWSIPKGLPDPGEDLERAARRETLEETGVVAGELSPLGSIDYKKSRKTIVAFGGAAKDTDAPRCASWEVDCAEFVPIDRAHELIHPDQRPFLDRLLEICRVKSGHPERF
jgi:predicted NUDIX family NTP pyrophosphohydrolase